MEDKITVEQAQEWANALRSGKYKQANSNLQNVNGYCCLGVACDIFIPEEKIIRNNNFIAGGYPRVQKHAPEWLKTINNNLAYLAGNTFTDLNDACKYSFDEIADIIELVYVHKALDDEEDNSTGS